MNDIMKIVKSLEESDLLMKDVSKAIKNETEEQRDGFFGTLLGTLDTSLLENMFEGKGVMRPGLKDKAQLDQVKIQLEQARIFNVASCFQ